MGNREQLLDGARSAVVELGYANTTAREIAARAGTSLAAIGYHFGSTDALLLEAVADTFRTWRTRFAATIDHGDLTGPAAVRAIGAELDLLFDEQRALFSVLLEGVALASRDAEAIERLTVDYAEDRHAVAVLIRRIRGRTSPTDELLAATLIAVVDGLFVQYLLTDDPPRPSAVLAELQPLIVDRARRPR